jgi:hypothetical protein
MTADTLRWLAVIVATAAVIAVVLSVGIRWEQRSPEMRAKGIVFAYLVSVNDYGIWYARTHRFPLNTALYLLLPGLAAAVAVYVYYLVKNVRSDADVDHR